MLPQAPGDAAVIVKRDAGFLAWIRRLSLGRTNAGAVWLGTEASRPLAWRPLGKRTPRARRSSVSSRRLCRAHNSAIVGGQDHAFDAATASVAYASRRRPAADDR